MGEWRSTGGLELTRPDGSSFGSHGCPSFWTVQSQDGGNFSGIVLTSGNGRNSDRLCHHDASFTGTMTAEGGVTLKLDKPLAQGCSRVEDDGTFTGTTNAEGGLSIASRAAVTCLDNDNRQQDGTRTITFSWWRPRD